MADPLIVTPGQTVAPPDWDALSQQHGGIKSSVIIPMTDPRIVGLIAADPSRDFTQHPIYRYYMNDGTYVEAYGQENGQDVQIIDYKPSAKFQQQQTQQAKEAPPGGKPYLDDGPEAGQSGRRWGWNPATKAYDRDLGPSPAAQQPTTASDRKPVDGHPGVYSVTTKDAKTNQTETHFEDEQGNRVAAPTAPTQTNRVPVEGKPGVYQVTSKNPTTGNQETHFEDESGKKIAAPAEAGKPVQAEDGSWGYWDTSQPGAPKWTPISGGPAAQLKPVQVNGTWGVWKPGANGGAPTFAPIDVPAAGKSFKNVDPWDPDFSQPDLGLGKWSQAQRAKIGLPPEQGGITQEDYNAAVTEAHGRAGTTITNVAGINDVTRQRALDIENQRVQRSGEAAGDFKNAVGVFNDVWKYADPSTGSIRNLIPGLMAEQQKYRQQREADAAPMPALHPMFQNLVDQTRANAVPPAVAQQSPPATPPGQPAIVPDAQAAANEAARQQQAAANPVFAPAPPTNVQPAPPTPGEPGGPSLQTTYPTYQPPPPMAPATVPTPSALPPADEFGRTPASGGATATPPPDASSEIGTSPPYNPDPALGPVGMAPAPGPLTAFAKQALPTPDVAPPPSPGPLSGLPGQVPATFNPVAASQRYAQLGFSPDALAQAMAELGMAPGQAAA